MSRSKTYNGKVDTVYLGAWPKDVLTSLKGFDEDLVRNQDDELSFRINKKGGIIWQTPEICSFYTPRDNFKSLFKQYFQYGYWKFPILIKHKISAKLRHIVPSLFIFLYLLSLFIGIKFKLIFLFIILPPLLYFFLLFLILFYENKNLKDLYLLLFSSISVLIMHLSYGFGYLYCLIRFFVTRNFKSNSMSTLSR